VVNVVPAYETRLLRRSASTLRAFEQAAFDVALHLELDRELLVSALGERHASFSAGSRWQHRSDHRPESGARRGSGSVTASATSHGLLDALEQHFS
jgi:hypothetical protein